MKTTRRPSYRELLANSAQPTGVAWGVFSASPQRGTLNFITPERIADAAKCIQSGRVFNLNWEITHPSPGLFNRKACKHNFPDDPAFTGDSLDQFDLHGSSHWEAASHVHHSERGHYLGLKKITRPEANPIGIDQYARHGIVGRGVLVDIARHLKKQGRRLSPISRDPITLADLKAALSTQNTVLQEGDILLCRTGWLTDWRTIPEFRHDVARNPQIPGLSGAAKMAEFLWDAGIAAIASDNPTVEVYPFESDADNLHHRLLVNLGMPLGKMFDLDLLAAACNDERRYEFFFSSAPLNVPGGTGSPANALAIR
ncbi:MAG: cyclase family protein [Pedosphaera sp.]|nr:cyclase family protein [Pedosphaera sp.]